MVSTCCPYSPVLQEERLALHKLGIHMRAVVILDEDDSDDDMMRFKNNDTPFWSSLISLVHVLSYISVQTPTVNPPLGHLSVVKAMFPNSVNVLSLFTGIAGRERFALHKLGIHMRAVVDVSILDDQMMIVMMT